MKSRKWKKISALLQEEIRIGFREQTYKVKLDESGIGKITIPDSLVPGYFGYLYFSVGYGRKS